MYFMSITVRTIPVKGKAPVRLECLVTVGRFTKHLTYRIEDIAGHLYASATEDEPVKIEKRAKRVFGQEDEDTLFLKDWIDEFRQEYQQKRSRRRKSGKSNNKYWHLHF